MSPHAVVGRASSSPTPSVLLMKRICGPFPPLTGAVDGLGPGMVLLLDTRVGPLLSFDAFPEGSDTCSFSLYHAYTLSAGAEHNR